MIRKLSMFQRIVLMGILPEKGTFITLKLLRELKEALAPTEVEVAKLGIRENPMGGLTWDQRKDTPVEIEIGDICTDLIRKTLLNLDKKEELTSEHLSIYEVFIN